MKLKPADTWFSKCVRHAARWTCEKCGRQYTSDKAQGLDCSHHYGRRKKSVRWAKENASALCMACHRWFHEYPAESGRWLEEYLGKGMLELLQEKSNTLVKVTKQDEREIAKHYKSEYERMVKEGTHDFESWQ